MYFNPANDFYMQQSYPLIQTQQFPQVVTKYVGNIEEARAFPVEPCLRYLFLDSGNGKIYFKELGNNGRSIFISYAQEQNETKENTLDSRIANIEKILGGLINGNESISSNADYEQSDRSSSAEFIEHVEKPKPTNVSKGGINDKWQKRN